MGKGRQASSTGGGAAGRKAHHTIESLEVSGGFLKGARFQFADGLNCIIGGRGTGKTTVLEFVRHVLGMGDDERVSSTRAKAFRAQVQENLEAGHIRLGVRTKHEVRYTAVRPWNDSAQVFNAENQPTAISLDRDLIFKADIYSQSQIEEIAKTPAQQLALIDSFALEDIRRIDSEVAKLVRDLGVSATDLTRIDHEIWDLSDSARELNTLEQKLEGLRTTHGPDAELVNEGHAQKALRQKELRTLEDLRGDLRRVHVESKTLLSNLVRRLETRIDADLAKGPNREVFRALSGQLDTLTALLERASATLSEQVETADAVLRAQDALLADHHATQEAAYRQLMARSEEEAGRIAERAQLQAQHAQAAADQKELSIKQEEREEKQRVRRAAVAKLSELRDERFHLRDQVARWLTGELEPTVRVSVTQNGDSSIYRETLTEALKGQSMKFNPVTDRLVENLSPVELATLLQKNDAYLMCEKTGIKEDQSQKVVTILRDTALLYGLETVELQDVPLVELLDGPQYKDARGLSTGQKCTSILPILLLESERPLLIDQPEDNLDNAFIYETVVKSIQATRGKRQLIFVTHNPNIPVLGDADRVFVMTSDGEKGRLAKSGTVDELKKDIELLLEGGSEAFQLRQKRYGY